MIRTPEANEEHVVPFAGAANDELKVVLLHMTPPPDSEIGISPEQAEVFFGDPAITSNARLMDKWYLGNRFSRAADQGMYEPAEDGGYRRTIAGDLALSLGGHLLDIGVRNNVPVRTLVGENGNALNPGSAFRNPIVSRLATFFALTQLTSDRRPSAVQRDIINMAADVGVGAEAVRGVVDSLEKSRVVEKTRLGKHVKVNLRKVPGTEYRAAIEEYLLAFATFACDDEEFMHEGRRKASQIIGKATANGTLGMLIRRAQFTSPRFDQDRHKKATNGAARPRALAHY